jgi:RHS repeat-associated protein
VLFGRQTDYMVVTFGAGVDGSVRRLQWTYDAVGLLHQLTSYSDVGGTAVANQIQSAYNGFQQLVTQHQEHGGTVDTTFSPTVQYSFANGSVNTTRPTGVTYPNGRAIAFGYASADDDALSRVTTIADSSEANGVAYTYLGLSVFIEANYPEPGVAWNLATGSEATPYAGLDRFGRVVDCLWQGPSSPIDDIQYGLDRLGNRLWRQNAVAPSDNDELYANDPLQRLVTMSRGTLDEAHASIVDEVLGEAWTLDATGNWSAFSHTDEAMPANSYSQTRASNGANEITAITSTLGATWTQPIYDRAGNMTTIPGGDDPTVALATTYDAWNRAIVITDTLTCVYDGQNRRVSKTSSGASRHYYYSANWQILEERIAPSAIPDRHVVWGARYIDELIFRDRSADATLDERLYAIQDANWNVTAIVSAAGDVCERYSYNAYGVATVMNAAFESLAGNTSLFDWETRYAGYRWDPESRLNTARYRYGHMIVGTWLSRDLMSYGDSANQYQNVRSNPINRTDPTGLYAWCGGGQVDVGGFIMHPSLAVKGCWDDCNNFAVAATIVSAPPELFQGREGAPIVISNGAGAALQLIGEAALTPYTCVKDMGGAFYEGSVSGGAGWAGSGSLQGGSGAQGLNVVVAGGVGVGAGAGLGTGVQLQLKRTYTFIKSCTSNQCPCCHDWWDVCQYIGPAGGSCYLPGALNSCALSLLSELGDWIDQGNRTLTSVVDEG